jgi:ATP-dependent helicase YprA (DUF1998 family)
MDVFALRDHLISDYTSYIQSFIRIRDPHISLFVAEQISTGLLWPDALIQLNPAFEPGEWIEELTTQGILHEKCNAIFRSGKDRESDDRPFRLHRHQADALRTAKTGGNYVLTTGTGSGKSLSYILPIVDSVLRRGSGRGIQAIVVYPMNALANSQYGELEKFLRHGFEENSGPVTFERYTGQESDEQRQRIKHNPPDILLTNYMMLELILTRPDDGAIIKAAQGLRFLVLDEMHTYRGRQGADVSLLVRRLREATSATELQCVGTSATLASGGGYDTQRAKVAEVASVLFGTTVLAENVIGETLRRATPKHNLAAPTYRAALIRRLTDPTVSPPQQFTEFVADPLSVWIENTFGIAEETGTGRLVRTRPRSITGEGGAASELSALTGVPVDGCTRAIQEGLLAGYACEPNPETGFPPFAFRLHQFISRGDSVYATLEKPENRYLTVQGQKFAPDGRERILLPLAFCRECGQEYYTVRWNRDEDRFLWRDLQDIVRKDDNGDAGFLYVGDWSETDLARLPDDWTEIEDGEIRLKRSARDKVPRPVPVKRDGSKTESGREAVTSWWVTAPFDFCLRCGVSYNERQSNDFAKLASLSSEGRSTATTILSLSAIRRLREQETLPKEARKLLSFTDNRQDASLQAGHFNDFVEVALIRAALFSAVQDASPKGLTYRDLPERTFETLGLDRTEWMQQPDARRSAREEADAAFQDILAYRLYRDLQRGWRVTSPNLEQCGLLKIEYADLDDICEEESLWNGSHVALTTATPAHRKFVVQTLLDFMRRELAIKVQYLEANYQERMKRGSDQHLRRDSAWSFDENEVLERGKILYPRSRRPAGDYLSESVFLSTRGGFGQFLRRNTTFPANSGRLKLTDTETIIRQLLSILTREGLLEEAEPGRNPEEPPGYQLKASALRWKAGDGTEPTRDPIRVPNAPTDGARTNEFFLHFYQTVAASMRQLEAREHTAQVPYDEREKREHRFRRADLPLLYCSPTMELGIDIASLNVVNMRNVPPTPANYAQRSGRAGRSGQPALVFTYCTTGSPHDQYFFKRPASMVAGAVAPPRLDLANEDLVRAHVHAVWLSEASLSLGKSLRDLLRLDEFPALPLGESIQARLNEPTFRKRAKACAERVLATLGDELPQTDWYSESWLEDTLAQIGTRFDRACDRWRQLYRSAMQQQKAQNEIMTEPARSQSDKEAAKRLRAEAEQQLHLLLDVENIVQSDFYSYRYFAGEGFLPGYNFPRLPLSAFIPGRSRKEREEFLSRPRFLAISEFGPRSIIYHEGAKFEIDRVILTAEQRGSGENSLFGASAKLCPHCGYLHTDARLDKCEFCEQLLDAPLTQLFRLQNVATRRRQRINSDEEERSRLGYRLQTGVRFTEPGNGPSYHIAEVMTADGSLLAHMAYGQQTTLWRINLGWRRSGPERMGFVLDLERGRWASERQDQNGNDGDTDMSARTARVIPFVEDRRNALLLRPETALPVPVMASLQAALKSAIQVVYQLEDSELAVEPLPNDGLRRQVLFYESAEGGAGVLRRLLDDPDALREVAQEALRLCHFSPDTGEDERRALGATEDCVAACYSCLMSYYNQRDHRHLDRHAIKDVLIGLAAARVAASPTGATRNEHRDSLLARAGSELERKWLRFLDDQGYRLPTEGQKLIAACGTKPDFWYDGGVAAAIYIDGPPHDYDDVNLRDAAKTECMEDCGYLVIRFHHQGDWEATLRRYPSVFGRDT